MDSPSNETLPHPRDGLPPLPRDPPPSSETSLTNETPPHHQRNFLRAYGRGCVAEYGRTRRGWEIVLYNVVKRASTQRDGLPPLPRDQLPHPTTELLASLWGVVGELGGGLEIVVCNVGKRVTPNEKHSPPTPPMELLASLRAENGGTRRGVVRLLYMM